MRSNSYALVDTTHPQALLMTAVGSTAALSRDGTFSPPPGSGRLGATSGGGSYSGGSYSGAAYSGAAYHGGRPYSGGFYSSSSSGSSSNAE